MVVCKLHSDLDDGAPEASASCWAQEDGHGRNVALAGILAQVSREALQGETLDAVLQRIVDCLVARLPVTIASILLLDDAGSHFTHEVWAGELDLMPPVLAIDWPVGKGAAGRCARLGVPQLLTDVARDADYIASNSAVHCEYLVPIRHRERLHGVLNIESTRPDFFGAEACAVFDAIADQIAGAIHLARIAAELAAANRKLEQLSMSDGLTGIANRRCFDQRLVADWQRCAREQQSLAMLLVDADCFKPLNDAMGHLYGDECLRNLAQACARVAVGDEDLVARFGGEELALLLPGRTLEQALAIGERLRREVEAAAMPHPASVVAPHVTVSVGASALVPGAKHSPVQLVQAADRALYTAKGRGRNCVAWRDVPND